MFYTSYMDVLYAIVKVYSQKRTVYMDVLYFIHGCSVYHRKNVFTKVYN